MPQTSASKYKQVIYFYVCHKEGSQSESPNSCEVSVVNIVIACSESISLSFDEKIITAVKITVRSHYKQTARMHDDFTAIAAHRLSADHVIISNRRSRRRPKQVCKGSSCVLRLHQSTHFSRQLHMIRATLGTPVPRILPIT